MGTNKCASQAGMNAYGTRRHLYDPKCPVLPPRDNTTISLQMGTNKGASQVWAGNQPSGGHPTTIITAQSEKAIHQRDTKVQEYGTRLCRIRSCSISIAIR